MTGSSPTIAVMPSTPDIVRQPPSTELLSSVEKVPVTVYSASTIASKAVAAEIAELIRSRAKLGQRVVLLSSRPGRVVREWSVGIPQPRRIEDPAVGDLSTEITEHLRREIVRHGH